MAQRQNIAWKRTAPPGAATRRQRLRHHLGPVFAAGLCLVFSLLASAAAGGPDGEAGSREIPTAAALYELSGSVAEGLTRFSAVWRMTMIPEPAHGVHDVHDVEPFVADMHMWRQGPNFRHETRMPPELLSAAPQGLSMTGDMPSCLVLLLREDDGVLYCQLFDGGWQVYSQGEFDFGIDIPFALTGSPEDAGLVLTGVAEDEWNGRPAWRIDGNMDEAISSADLPISLKTTMAMWVDQQSLLVIASESRVQFPPEALGGLLGGFVIRLELVEFDPGAHIPDELFTPPKGVGL